MTAPFRPDVEGLRALAVVAVLAFHAEIPGTAGGFVGVDVFFVISGFLISAILLSQLTSRGSVDFAGFYAGRFRRILPSAALVATVVMGLALLLLPPLAVRDAGVDALTAALQVANWRFIDQGTDYLAASSDHSPFLHFWSLAVEEQFYVVWPVLLASAALVARWFRRSTVLVVGTVVLGTFVASLAWAIAVTQTSPPTAYMGTPARAWQFAAGALVALLSRGDGRLGTTSRSSIATVIVAGLGWGGLAAIFWSTTAYSAATAYPGVAALVPTLGTVAVLLSTVLVGPSWPASGGLLAMRPLRALGRVSYAWYLWHWPAIVLVEARWGEQPWPVLAVVVAATIVPAWLTLVLVERPVRYSRAVATRPLNGLSVGVMATTIAVAASLGAGAVAMRSLSNVEQMAAAPTLQNVFADEQRSSGAVAPVPASARDDVPTPAECLTDTKESTSVGSCATGRRGGTPVVLFGDSHANQWLPALNGIAERRGWELRSMTAMGCPAPQIAPRQDGSRFSSPECAEWRQAAIRAIVRLRPEVVIVSSLNHYIPDSDEVTRAWSSTLAQLESAGSTIVYLVDTPWPGRDVPTCMSGAVQDWTRCAFPRRDAVRPDGFVAQVAAGQVANARVVNMLGYLCPDEMCPAARGGVLFYRDDSHITATAARVLEPALEAELDKVGVG